MFTGNPFSQRELLEFQRQFRPDTCPYALMGANHLFERSLQAGRWQRGVQWLLGRQRSTLYDLEDVKARTRVTHSHYCGVRAVPVSQIRGTDGRLQDFDGEFHPLQERVKYRWVSVAAAWFQDHGLPAVELVKVRNLYFVIDGHHRVSVARSLHKQDIDAIVTEWEVAGLLPWESGATAALEKPAFAA